MTEITLPDSEIEKIAQEMAEEIIPVKAQKGFERAVSVAEEHWLIGGVILHHPKYKKFGKQQGKLFATVANMVGMGERSVRYSVEFRSKFPGDSFEDVLPKLPGGKSPIWRDIVKELPSGKKENVEKETCAHEWVCQKCGATRR
jgi:hypothetical protein